jgi:hypothetical protein
MKITVFKNFKKPSQLTGIIIINNFKEKYTDKYKIVSGEAKGKG